MSNSPVAGVAKSKQQENADDPVPPAPLLEPRESGRAPQEWLLMVAGQSGRNIDGKSQNGGIEKER